MATRDPGEPRAGRPRDAPVHPGEEREPWTATSTRPTPYRARQLAPYRRDAGLHDSGLTGRYPGLRGSGSRDPRVHATGPGPAPGPTASPTGPRC